MKACWEKQAREERKRVADTIWDGKFLDCLCRPRLPVPGDRVKRADDLHQSDLGWQLLAGELAIVEGVDEDGNFQLRNESGQVSEQYFGRSRFYYVEESVAWDAPPKEWPGARAAAAPGPAAPVPLAAAPGLPAQPGHRESTADTLRLQLSWLSEMSRALTGGGGGGLARGGDDPAAATKTEAAEEEQARAERGWTSGLQAEERQASRCRRAGALAAAGAGERRGQQEGGEHGYPEIRLPKWLGGGGTSDSSVAGRRDSLDVDAAEETLAFFAAPAAAGTVAGAVVAGAVAARQACAAGRAPGRFHRQAGFFGGA